MKNNFIKWFIGFIDAEGNFQIFPKVRKNKHTNQITSYGVGYGIHLGIHLRDAELIYYIQSIFDGIGHVYLYSEKEEAHFAITKKDELRRFINIVITEHSLLTEHQSTRYKTLKFVLDNDIKIVRTLDEYNEIKNISWPTPDPFSKDHNHINEWIVGFVNGEGSFGVYRNGTVYRFTIEHTDQRVLELIKITLGLSLDVYVVKIREGRKQTYALTVSNTTDIDKVIKFFDNNESLKGYKLKQYNEFKIARSNNNEPRGNDTN